MVRVFVLCGRGEFVCFIQLSNKVLGATYNSTFTSVKFTISL